MKRNLNRLILAVFLFAQPFILWAQTPPDPPGGSPGTGGPGTVGSGAPIGDGVFILLALAMAYTARKIYIMRTEKQAEKA